ncbi:MAG: phosphoesterase [Gammaproteobacteria bacterium]|nr:phosphoesterase [Gammaproteobacteria bacterium]MYE53038.1 phosphoesterase [Gammaproteobacteria bacterium]
MSADDPISAALQLTAGATFHRCALQVNPHHYAGTYRGQPLRLDEPSYIQALIDKAEELGVSVLAVTDHNSVDGVEAIRQAANERSITVFPGFELSSRDGVHVLCLYSPNVEVSQLERFLGAFGVHDPETSSDPCERYFADVLATVRKQGGLCIAAHAVNDKGLLKALQGQARVKAWRDANLSAVQIPGAVDTLDLDFRKIVMNKDAQYIRRHAPESDLAVAVVNAKDVAEPDDLENPSATCWIKMSEVSIEGLRQAFLDPRSRIRLNSDPQPEGHSEFVAMVWQGGFLDGAAVHFNPNLNVLIGGRGAGKSTVIASLRYVLGLEPLGEEAQSNHTGILSRVLRSGTKISLLVQSHHPSPRHYRIERTIPNPPIVRDADTGDVLNLMPTDAFSGVEIYGQHEISELARSPGKLTRLLERFALKDDSLEPRKRALQQALRRSRSSIIDAEQELSQIEERLEALPGLEETLNRYREAGLEEDLKEQSFLVREERVIESMAERLDPWRQSLGELRKDLPLDLTFLSEQALEGLPGKEILRTAEGVLRQLSSDLERAFASIATAFEQADQGLLDVREKFNQRKSDVEAGYAKKLRELQKTRIDGDEFIQLRRRIEALRPIGERRAALMRIVSKHREQRRSLLVEWEDLKAEEYRALAQAGKRVTRKLGGRVRVRVEFAGNREPLFQLLRKEVGGRLVETVETLREVESLSLSAFAQACREGGDRLKNEFELTGRQAEALAEADDATIMRIEELDLPSTTQIELNTAPVDQAESWQALEDLSTGQKATAVLLLVLLESDAPLVVDQPEDDLDNRFITEGIVPRMREEKRRRQFLFSTHNANIPVLGDAELILGLSAAGDAEQGAAKIAPEHMGSIDAKPVRDLVEELLEGGEEAFERRRRKYGF